MKGITEKSYLINTIFSTKQHMYSYHKYPNIIYTLITYVLSYDCEQLLIVL